MILTNNCTVYAENGQNLATAVVYKGNLNNIENQTTYLA